MTDVAAGRDALACQRHRFTLPDGAHYLNCAYMGPLPRVAQEAGSAGIRRKGAPMDITAADFFTESDGARRRFAALIGGGAERVAIVPSVSYGIATVARNTRVEPLVSLDTVEIVKVLRSPPVPSASQAPAAGG